MSDIVERLRSWVYTDSQYATAREAADEIDRLRLSANGDCPVPQNAANEDNESVVRKTGGDFGQQPTLTDEERQVIFRAMYRVVGADSAILWSLLDRTK
jgi:hypothetical protein